MSSILNIDNLNYKNIIKNLSFSVDNPNFITISGSNKSGKTTLIRILSGQIKSNRTIKILNKYIEDYNTYELSKKIRMIIPSDQNKFLFNTVEKELSFIAENINNLAYLNEIIKLFKLKKFLKENPNNLNMNIKTKVYLAKALLVQPDILLIDDLNYYLGKKESADLLEMVRKIAKEKNTTVIYTTNSLEDTIKSDYLYIMSSGTIALAGKPIDILQKDNVLNKLGLELPFMIDLSVKLRDYNLIEDIKLDMDRMVDELWK